MEEVYVDVEDYPGYRISNFGNIFSKKLKKVMTIPIDCDGYCRIGLWKNQVCKKFFIHRLVALHFIPNPENKPTVNHKDGNKLNNHINNLEWNTMKENNQHAVEVLGKVFTGRNKVTVTVVKGDEEINLGTREMMAFLKCSGKSYKRLMEGGSINGYSLKKNVSTE